MWAPSTARVAATNLAAFIGSVRSRGRLTPASVQGAYDILYRWSITEPTAFWDAVWRFTGIIGERQQTVVHGLERMAPPDPTLGPRWFPGTRLNFAENLLRHDGDHPALIVWTESGPQREWSFAELRAEVGAFAAGLRATGVGVGDRVAAYVPNGAEAIIGMLATTSIGAIWSSCSPDFGVAGVLDRFKQIEPKVLLAVEQYEYNSKQIDVRERIKEVSAQLPTLRRTVTDWTGFAAPYQGTPPVFERGPFDAPAFILYSSGTTGLPKCIVHGAGGTLIQHLKELSLHTDLGPEDRLFYVTTTGWMMWNWMVSALALGTTLVLYDGAPIPAARPTVLWDMAYHERVTVFGTSAKYLSLAEKSGLAPARTHDLAALKTILSTGSPLTDRGFDYVYQQVKPDVSLNSISGGTDIVSCFMLGNPFAPVWRGELQAPGLGMAIDVFDDHGSPTDATGELVCTMPFPSMPVAFWADPDNARYRETYFDTFPGVWRHGDWVRRTPHHGFVIYGRSDTTLNPGGVRIGTAEIYRQVERFDEILDSVVVDWDVDGDVSTALFVRLAPGATLDDTLRERIKTAIRTNASPRHVPRVMRAVADIPRTVSGKIAEMAVRDVLHGRVVKNVDALANPESLEQFRGLVR